MSESDNDNMAQVLMRIAEGGESDQLTEIYRRLWQHPNQASQSDRSVETPPKEDE